MKKIMQTGRGLVWLKAIGLSLFAAALTLVPATRAFAAIVESPAVDWTVHSAAEQNNWRSIAYGNGIFVATAINGTNRVMTSADAVTWTAHSAADASTWRSITYGNGIFVAIANSGTNRVMTSPDGINWTARTAADAHPWQSVTYGNGMFVAVSCGISSTFCDSTAGSRVMTSPDGINWTARADAADDWWFTVAYGNGVFVALSINGTNAMTSPDGINWTLHSIPETSNWRSITYGNGMFVAVKNGVAANNIITSPDGVNWTARPAPEASGWYSIAYGNGTFVAVAYTGTNRIMTSPDGINWTAMVAPETNSWSSITFGGGMFVSLSEDGTNRVMTSLGGTDLNLTDDDFTGTPVEAGTTTPSVLSNDTLASGPALNSADYTLSITNNGGLAGAILNNNGTISIPASIAEGTYVITYIACELDAPDYCEATTATIAVLAASTELTDTGTRQLVPAIISSLIAGCALVIGLGRHRHYRHPSYRSR